MGRGCFTGFMGASDFQFMSITLFGPNESFESHRQKVVDIWESHKGQL